MKSKNITNISLLAETEVPNGTSKRLVCPICNGGSTNEKCFVITRDNGLIRFRCFRDKCKVSGRIRIGGTSLIKAIPENKNNEKANYFSRAFFTLDENNYIFFKEKFGLDPSDLIGVRRCPELDRFILPIYSPSGRLRGHVARSFSQEPKAINYNNLPEEPFIGWFYPVKNRLGSSQVVIVEDWFSGAKVAKAGLVGVTLNGTLLNWEVASEVSNYDEAILALDLGTLPTMLGYVQAFGCLFKKGMTVWKLTKDLKYEKEEKIRNVASNRKEAIICFDKEP